MVRFVETLEEFKSILAESGDKLILVDFTASWCGPCRMIAPHFKEFSEAPENQNVIFLKVDVDEAQDVAAFCAVKCMPTFHFYKNGKMVLEFSGANETQLKEGLEKLR
ncbi:thioredoxin-like [Centropristis striata]|uniref:thioredoxin-like n=1 Tax=Centropristis striata TaxID=184440 RepID=UPI0027E154C9|nr:thioredoxin-like [Centropristis striata]